VTFGKTAPGLTPNSHRSRILTAAPLRFTSSRGRRGKAAPAPRRRLRIARAPDRDHPIPGAGVQANSTAARPRC
jgi:hypothetical protein